MDNLNRTQRALKVETPGHIAAVDGVAIPLMDTNEVLVEVKAVAINPFDGKSATLSPTLGSTAGCDFAGIVVRNDVHAPLTIGDRVCGFVFGNNPNRPGNGAFAQFVAVPADLLMRIPATMDFEAAATLGVGIATVGLVLYHELKLPLPLSLNAPNAQQQQFVLVYGGSTATGTLAIQMLRLSGFKVVCTCSPHHDSLVKRLGAVKAFDYRSQTCGDDIRAFTANTLSYAIDCITTTASMQICYEAIGTAGGRYVSLDPFPLRGHVRRSVQPSWILCLTMLGNAIPWARPYKRPARPQDRAFAGKWMAIAEGLLADGAVSPHPHRIMSGGLAGVLDGVAAVQTGQVSGVKLVYRIG